MKVAIDEARTKLTALLASTGADPGDVSTMVDMRMEYDLHNNRFSGFDEIEGLLTELSASRGKQYTVVVDQPSMKLLQGNGRSARLIGMDAAHLVATMAKEHGIALVGIYDATYHGILETYARVIARHDLIGLVGANGGPRGVVPFGGKKDLFGTNPLAYAIPTLDMPIVFDAATSKYPYGAIRQARARNEELPAGSFLDDDGNYTRDPNQATRIVPFGEHKGYAINLLLEVMTGAMVRSLNGPLQTGNPSELGSFFIAIDPARFTPIEDFKRAVSELATEIEGVEPAEGATGVFVPGFRGERAKRAMVEKGEMEVDDAAWQKFLAVYSAHVH